MMKPAVCTSCGKDLKGVVPLDAYSVLCFRCSEADIDAREASGELGEARQKKSKRGVYG